MKLTFKQFSDYTSLPDNLSEEELEEAFFGLFKTDKEKEDAAKDAISKQSALKDARDKLKKETDAKRAALLAQAAERKATLLAKKKGGNGGPQSGSAAARNLADREFALGENKKPKKGSKKL